jgi:nanoRNase/pAp phosphatase (c-di-AMP/oligoRNAs hydrolase)
VQNDMLQTAGVLIAIVFKVYADGKITAAIRCNPAAPVGAKLAGHFGGGGHDYASGFKVTDGRAFEALQTDCLDVASELLAKVGVQNEAA